MKTREEKHISHPLKLFTDGGVISKNPSPYGGTWAWVLVDSGKELYHDSGILYADLDIDTPITNNQMELFAILKGLSWFDDPRVFIEICSDSMVSLGRVFKGSSMHNIPDWMCSYLEFHRRRFFNWSQFSYTLIGGHPTRTSLKKGTNAKGQPVSRWNVLVDQLCKEEASRYWNEKNKDR